MNFLCSLAQLTLADLETVGDKAAYLGELMRAGFAAPRGFCLTADAYRAVVANPLNDKIAARLAATEIDDPVELEAATDDIRAWIEAVPVPAALTAEIENALPALGALSFAVRASRVIEDVPNPAASGLPQAYLGVVGAAAVWRSVKLIWALPWNSRAIYFRQRKKIPLAHVTMAVVLQPMLNPAAAGVLFTANPLTGAADEIHIDATFGLGEAIIAARWKPDHFVVAKPTHAIRDRNISTKNVMEGVAADGTLQTLAVTPAQQAAAVLGDSQVVALAALGEKIETHFRAPQDIEWGWLGAQPWIFQTRPLRKK